MEIAASVVMEDWFCAIKISTIQKPNSLTCGTLTAKLLTVAVESMSSGKKLRSQSAQNKRATGNIQLATALHWCG
jgi:hypothetical protein